ncbi:DUF6415 family natural product biosynthesis protein [Streptomyces sp. NPDC002540]
MSIALVLDDAAPVPESERDMEDLLLRLRGHLMQLGAEGPRTGPWAQALGAARELAAQAPPVGDFLQSRVHLRRLALNLKSVLDETGEARLVCGHQPECPPGQHPDCEAGTVQGLGLLSNGVMASEGASCLMPEGQFTAPRRSRPPVDGQAEVRT